MAVAGSGPGGSPLRGGGSGAPLLTLYMYRAASGEDYPPVNVNAGNIAGVLWYLHHEVVIQYPRKFDISKIVRYKVQARATESLWQLGMNFGPREAFDKGQCTGPFVCGREASGQDQIPKFCNDGESNGGPLEWRRHGFVVGCNVLGEFPFPMFPVYYPGATWYSLPGPCPSRTFDSKTEACAAEAPGGFCKGVPTGAGDCTWSYEKMGEVDIDELVGRSAQQLDSEGGREYDPYLDRGSRFSWWDGIASTGANLVRVNETRALFARKYPNQTRDEDMDTPPCDFNLARFYHDYFGKDPHSGPCRDARPGSDCYASVAWAMQDGIHAHPEWYPELTPAASFKDFQRLLYAQGKEACPRRPCEEGEQEAPEEQQR